MIRQVRFEALMPVLQPTPAMRVRLDPKFRRAQLAQGALTFILLRDGYADLDDLSRWWNDSWHKFELSEALASGGTISTVSKIRKDRQEVTIGIACISPKGEIFCYPGIPEQALLEANAYMAKITDENLSEQMERIAMQTFNLCNKEKQPK